MFEKVKSGSDEHTTQQSPFTRATFHSKLNMDCEMLEVRYLVAMGMISVAPN